MSRCGYGRIIKGRSEGEATVYCLEEDLGGTGLEDGGESQLRLVTKRHSPIWKNGQIVQGL